MTDTTMTSEETKALAREMLGLAVVAGGDPLGQAAALLTAATVIIEREVGTNHASAALMALVEPTIAGWERAAGRV